MCVDVCMGGGLTHKTKVFNNMINFCLFKKQHTAKLTSPDTRKLVQKYKPTELLGKFYITWIIFKPF